MEEPSSVRIKALADRLYTLRTQPPSTPEPPKGGSTERGGGGSIEDRLMRLSTSSKGQAQAALEVAHTRLADERDARALLFDRDDRDARYVMHSASLDLVDAAHSRRNIEARVMRHVDERCLAIQRSLAREKREREEAEERAAAEMGETVASLVEAIQEERALGQRHLTELGTRHSNEFQVLRDEIARERAERERNTTALVGMLENLSAQVRSDLQLERQDREGTEVRILRLAEEALGRPRPPGSH